MKDERREVPSPPIDLAASANLDQEAGRSPENARRDVSRRGFLGKVLAALAAGAAGFWSWRKPATAHADIICDNSGCHAAPTPTPGDYTAQTTGLINNLVADFNAHNAQAVVNVFSSSGIDTSAMLTHMNNAFSAFPNLQLTISSMSVSNLGSSVTINHSMTGTHSVAVADSMVVSASPSTTTASTASSSNGGPQPVPVTGVTDTATGTHTLSVLNGSVITSVTGNSNLAEVFASHGALLVVN